MAASSVDAKTLMAEVLGLARAVVEDSLKNERLSQLLVEAAALEPKTLGAGAAQLPKADGLAVYNTCTALAKVKDTERAQALLKLAIPLAAAGKMSAAAQLRAFQGIVSASGDVPSLAELEKTCGVGVVVTPEQITAAAAAAIDQQPEAERAKGWSMHMGRVIGAAKAAQPWADPKALKDAVDAEFLKRFGEKPAPAKGKAKGKGGEGKGKGGAGAAAAAAAGAADLPEKLERPAGLDKHEHVRRLAQLWLGSGASSTDRAAALAAGADGAAAPAPRDVLVEGWCNSIRKQGNKCVFVDLRDGSGSIQCVLLGKVVRVARLDEILRREATIRVWGSCAPVKEGQRAPGGVEVKVVHWEIVGLSPPDLESVVQYEGHSDKLSGVDTLMDQRHLVMRGGKVSSILKMRSAALSCFRRHLEEREYYEVHPPTLTMSQAEGGSELFDFDYFGEKAYLTQSSQLYLETALPSMGRVYCCISSYRAEASRTRRHLSEYTHLEAELPFITFDDLLNAIEDLVVDVAERVHAYVKARPELQALVDSGAIELADIPKKPFKRLDYRDAVEFCREHNIYKDEETKTHFEFGDDIPEAPERRMTDMIGVPVLMTRFPLSMKAFYMQRDPADDRLTESVDLLMPSVGEVVGGSMRIHDYDELMAAYKREGIDPTPYYWFTDQRKFGTCPHGGYGLGVERFMMWLFKIDHIRDACMFPRYKGRCMP